jgi:hypothetical protein
MNLELTKEEQQQLMTCLDLAVKQGGLQAASVLLPLAAKIQQLKDSSDAGNADTPV